MWLFFALNLFSSGIRKIKLISGITVDRIINMSEIIEGNGVLRCNVYSHETQILDQVCIEETCVNRGLQCERCLR